VTPRPWLGWVQWVRRRAARRTALAAREWQREERAAAARLGLIAPDEPGRAGRVNNRWNTYRDR
jgi:NADH:ubiquinone oxidoreductase subunit